MKRGVAANWLNWPAPQSVVVR